MSKHTPGPWAVKRGQVQAETSQGYVVIGAAPGWALKEQQANLALIAAAPELLAALQLAADYMAANVPANGWGLRDEAADFDRETALRVMYTALCKAKGEDANRYLSRLPPPSEMEGK